MPKPVATELEDLNRRLRERTAHIGTPRGPVGTVQKVYQRRGYVPGTYGAEVLMLETGRTRWVDLAQVYPQ